MANSIAVAPRRDESNALDLPAHMGERLKINVFSNFSVEYIS
jgi:hypothetical protein